LIVEFGWAPEIWSSGWLAERARRELTAAVVKHFQRYCQPHTVDLRCEE